MAGYKAKDIPNKLSESADFNSSEFIAEAFTEYITSSSPRKIAKKFGEYLNNILD